MPIVGGRGIHRRQITFDYPGTVTGQVCRGQVSPADREHLRAWLAGDLTARVSPPMRRTRGRATGTRWCRRAGTSPPRSAR